ncbi:MAG: glycosyltransferase family 2 protein [Alphaproteobacteria bacterium]|jgi:succinoglycan biosynthesis protein ExoW|nr:glycosyltransferase family 2 protein [Alphaproteobacteria bacterium]
MTPHKLKIAVVIPFYQKEAGLLRKAIKSAINQDYKCVMDIIIIDDGSPAPAYPECDELEYDKKRIQIRIIRQKNKGVAAARNLALENVSSDTDYIALLDPDDEWKPEHLKTIFKHSQNFDFYFCRHIRYDKEYTAYHKNLQHLSFSKIKPIHNTELIQLKGDVLKEFFLEKFDDIGGTFIINWKKYYNTRFDEEIHLAEDYLFFLKILLQNPKVLYSEKINVRAGNGLNIYYNLPSWKEPMYLKTSYLYFLLIKKYDELIQSYSQYQKYTNLKKKKNASESILCFLYCIFHNKNIAWKWVQKIITIYPQILLWFFPIILQLAIQKTKNKYHQNNNSSQSDNNNSTLKADQIKGK